MSRRQVSLVAIGVVASTLLLAEWSNAERIRQRDDQQLAARVYGAPISTGLVEHWISAATRGGQSTSDVRASVMVFLINAKWLAGEARERHLSLTRLRIAQELRRMRLAAFPTRARWQRYLRRSGMTLADVLYRVRIDLLSRMIQRDVVAGLDDLEAQTAARQSFLTEFARRWRSRTSCARAYRVAMCSRLISEPVGAG